MNHRRHPARTPLWILAGAAAIGLTLYLAIPGSPAYVLISLFVLLHFVMHAGHGHAAHGHNQHDHNQHDPGTTDAPTTHGAHTHGAPTPERAATAHTANDQHDRRLP